MHGHLILQDGTHRRIDRAEVEQELASGTFFWLDLVHPDEETIDLLSGVFHFHELAVEDAGKFGQRPKVDDYDDFVFLSLFGAVHDDGGRPLEVHAFYTEENLVTVRQGAAPPLEGARRRVERQCQSDEKVSSLTILYHIADELVDSFFPVLGDLDDRIDTLQDEILVNPTDAQLGELFDLKRRLVGWRKVVTPQRDMFARLAAGVNALPGMTSQIERYFRDVYDHLIRISDLVDNYRDLLSSVMDTHVSVTSNKLNVVMKQLTMIATVFLPLTFLTGFFGQNFAYLVDRIRGGVAFWGIGIGSELVALILLLLLFWRRKWL